MAKSTKHQTALGSFADFRPPWVSEAGAESDIVPEVLSKLIYNLKLDVAKARDAKEDTEAALAEAETERDEAKKAAAENAGPEAQRKIEQLEADLAKVTGERDALKKDAEVADLRKEVLGDFETKYPKAAKYVKGETEDELKESLAAVAEDFGIDLEGDGDDADKDDDEPTLSTRPRSQSLLNLGDKDNGKPGEREYDFDAVAAQIAGGRIFG